MFNIFPSVPIHKKPPPPGNASVARAMGYLLIDGKWCARPRLGTDYIPLWDQAEIPGD